MGNNNSPVIITGSNGLIGTRLVETLAKKYPIIAFDNKPAEIPVENVKYVRFDMTKDAAVQRALSNVWEVFGNELTSVVHLAAHHDFSSQPNAQHHDTNIEGTRHLLKLLTDFQVKQFIYPINWPSNLSEMQPAEKMVKTTLPSVPKVLLRIASVYDEWCHCNSVAQQIRQIYENSISSHLYPGDKSRGQPFVHLDDIVYCIHKTIDKADKLAKFETFLISEPEILSYEKLQNTISNYLCGNSWTTIEIPKALAKAGTKLEHILTENPDDSDPTFIPPWTIDLGDNHYPVEIKKANRRLEWMPRYRIASMLRVILLKLKQDPKLWYEKNGFTWDPPLKSLEQLRHSSLLTG